MQGSTPIVGDMFRAARDSMAALRAEITEVRPGPIVSGLEFVEFKFRGEPCRLQLKGPCWVVFGDGRETDKSIALRCLLEDSDTIARFSQGD